jgi:hypothetical protein
MKFGSAAVFVTLIACSVDAFTPVQNNIQSQHSKTQQKQRKYRGVIEMQHNFEKDAPFQIVSRCGSFE